MSYQDTKEKTARKGRKIKYILLAALVFLWRGCASFRLLSASTWKYYVKLPEVAARRKGLKFIFSTWGRRLHRSGVSRRQKHDHRRRRRDV
ncbi:MAG: hypothetical protein ACLRSW_05810 [Christensenellaceae bacterium]